MKKSALAALGLVGACAACCAIPVALPFLGGLSALGAGGLGATTLGAERDVAIAVAVVAFALVAGGVVWMRRRTAPCSPAAAPPAAACGCSGPE